MNETPLRAAVIGLGMGRQHLAAYRQIPGVEIALICDSDPARLEAVSAEYPQARTVTDWREVAQDPAVDVVSLCTPDHLHFEQASALALCGKHILCEKPMVTSAADARALLRIVHETGITFAVGNVNRFVPQFALAARYAREGRLGDLFLVESDYIHDMRRVFQQTPWRTDAAAPQNAIFGGGVHPVDLARWVAGEVVEVFACGNHKTVPEYNSPDNVLISLQFASGCVGKVWVTFGIRRQPEHNVTLNAFGGEGTIYTDSERPEARLYVPALAEGQHGWASVPFAPQVGHPVRAELEHLVECIRTGREPLVSVTDAARTVAVLAAAQQSLETGQPVPVEDIERPVAETEQLRMYLDDVRGFAEPELPPGYTLRTYQPGDDTAWLAMVNPAIGTTWDEAKFAEKMLNVPWFAPERLFFVEHAGQLLGTACAWQDKENEREQGYAHMVAVRPEARGLRLGRALMLAVLRWFEANGFTSCVLETDDFRLPAIGLYLSLGYVPVFRNEGHERRWAAVRVALAAGKR